MKKRFLTTLVFMLLLLSLAFPAFASENVQLNVNGDMMPSSAVYIENDVCMISADTFARLAGADVQWPTSDSFTIIENGNKMDFSVGKKEAMLMDKTISLPVEPVKTGDIAFIPLRAVSSAFGFEVGWDDTNWMVTLSRNESRDGMSVADLLFKSTAASQAFNTYAMNGVFDIAMNISADGKTTDQTPKSITSKISGQIQNKPFGVYMKQVIGAAAGDKVPEVAVETYMTQEKMYIKAPGQDWTYQDMPFAQDFWKQQQDIQSDPLKAAAQMKEMGILMNFGNDITLNNQEYYVVNAAIDMNKFKQGYQKMMDQAIQGMQGTASGNPADIQKQIQKLMDSARLDYEYSLLINKKTLISDVIKFDTRLQMSIANPDPMKEGEEQKGQPGEIKMDMNIKGDIAISDLGGSFKAPDVASAKEMNTTQAPSKSKE